MLMAAIEGERLIRDERAERDHSAPPGPTGDHLCAAIDVDPGPRSHRVHVAPICPEPGRGTTWLAGVADCNHRRRPGTVRAERNGACRFQRIGEPRLSRRGRRHLWTRDLAPRTQ